MFILKVAYFLLCVINISHGQSSNDICESKETCRDCIQEIDCDWCTEPINATGGVVSQCRSKNSKTKWCDPSKLTISRNISYKEIEDRQFSDAEDKTIQIKPQRVKLSLRKGQKFDLKFKFQITKNYPVDVYYIMDLSNTMKGYKTNLAKLGIKLADTMRNITKNFNIGFGSFIDKVDLPFTKPKDLSNMCKTKGICDLSYSFKNMVPLTKDYNSFVQNVMNAQVGTNIDYPEGGFDAIMQAMVCKKKIKWRDQARHLLVFSTDSDFHIAGDGKLAGVLEPNPGRCYEDDKEYLIYDYPSVSHINYVAKENNIIIILAIVPPKKRSLLLESYQLLSDNIENSKYGELDNNNKVIDIIVKNYEEIVQSVKFTSNATEDIDVQFSSNCNGAGKFDRCSNLHTGQVVEFTATIQLRQCPKDGETTKLISIRPESLSESLIIELDIQCDCPCSSKDDPTFVSNSSECNDIGDLTCGVCSCPEGRFGVNCQCDRTQSKSENITNCIREGTNDVCSGSGVCNICGKCECNVIPNNPGEKYSGRYCECDNFSCKREGGLLCSGKGKCSCNKCECDKGYSGDACDCDLATTNCRAGDSICSGHGTCTCNRCNCEMKNNNRYSGKFCEDCTSCPAQRCEELGPCVECQVFKTGIYKDTCETECAAFTAEKVNKFDNEGNPEFKKCKIPDNDTCIINFEYSYIRDDKLIIRALDRKICPESPNVLGWILGVVAAILTAGLIMLIIWKVSTTIHDKREYAKFEDEQKRLKWGINDNPLYKEATSTFANPAYKRASVRFSFRRE